VNGSGDECLWPRTKDGEDRRREEKIGEKRRTEGI
jgi:hypothetical protein